MLFRSAVWKYLDAISVSVGGGLPGNRESERKAFQGSIGPTVSFLSTVRRFQIKQAFGYTRAFYEYDIRNDGTVNSPDQYKSTTEIGLSVTEKFSLGVSVALAHAVNFQGTGKTTESSAISADYAFSQNVQTSLGVGTERGTMLPDGQSNRVRVFDPEVATAFFDLVIGI